MKKFPENRDFCGGKQRDGILGQLLRGPHPSFRLETVITWFGMEDDGLLLPQGRILVCSNPYHGDQQQARFERPSNAVEWPQFQVVIIIPGDQ
jgi:hypothetical protein